MNRPLSWERASFSILLSVSSRAEPQPFRVPGIVSGAFGIFRGDKKGLDKGHGPSRYSLVLVPSSGFVATFARQIDCKALAEELALLRVNWGAPLGEGVTGPDIEKAKAIIGCCR